MPPRPFNAKRQHQLIGGLLRPIDLQSALLLCNHVLTAWRGEASDPAVKKLVAEFRLPCSPFFIHLAVRQVLLNSLGPSARLMGTEDFKRLLALLWELLDHDPAMQDPGWKHADPTGWAIRYAGLQQGQFPLPSQVFGIAVALFTHELPVAPDEAADIPTRLTEVLGMPAFVFMRAGFVAASLKLATSGAVKLAGTASTEVVMANAGLIGEGVAENWPRFVQLASRTQAGFKEESNAERHTAASRYELYRFNVLRRRPIIDLGDARYLTVDRQLVFRRISLGLYYDLLEADGEEFTKPFGYRFANLVGDLAARACGKSRIWSECNVPKAGRAGLPSQNADHAYIGDGPNVLMECKALTPKARLMILGEPGDTDELVGKVARAVRQLSRHAVAIRAGNWTSLGLPARESYGMVVTYGEIPTVNGALFRDRAAVKLKEEGIDPLPYIVLSIEQFDSLMRAVERGRALDAAMVALCDGESKGFPGALEAELSRDAISSVTRDRADRFLATLPGLTDDGEDAE